MEIYPNVHQIDVPFDGRIVSVYLLLGKHPLLIDSGVANSPIVGILPYLEHIGLQPSDLWGIVNTHAHTDHCGGNHQLKEANSKLRIIAHELECADVQDPVAAVHAFYDPYRHIIGEGAADSGIRWNIENLGPGTPVDIPLHDGQQLWVEDDWPIEVHLTPGHTAGHLTLHDPRYHAAFAGDSIGWKGVVTNGLVTNFHPYLNVDAYLDTINKIKSWSLEYFCASHYPTLKDRDKIETFLEESREFIVDLDSVVSHVVERAGAPLSLGEITKAAVQIMGGDYLFDICSVMTVDAHLRRLREKGRIIPS